MLVIIVIYIIENIMCIDIKNYIFVVKNGIGNIVKVMEELIVNCKIFYYYFKFKRIKVYFCKNIV